jgi:hypothetical protein
VADIPLLDEGNKLLMELPAQLTTDVIGTPGGQRLAMTVRTPTTTLTVFLRGSDAKKWAHQLTVESSVMSDTGLVTANGASGSLDIR